MVQRRPGRDRVVVVGGGVLGTMHAWWARRAGLDVVHLDRDLEPRSATVRNFGLVWVSGRAPGDELAVALRARELWEAIGAEVPGVGFRPDGSLTLVTTPAELRVLEQAAARDDADARGFALLDPEGVRAVNPAVGGEILAGLHCRLDAVVEPRRCLPALREALAGDGYAWLGGRTAVEVDTGAVVDHTGERHDADLVVLCPGARRDGPMAALLAGEPLRHVQLQMLETEPLGERLTTSLADGDSLRYYPAFAVPALADLPPRPALLDEYAVQLLVSQRAGGELTIGDTHAYGEPFDFALDERPAAHLLARVEQLLGRPAPPVRRRWLGVYAQTLDGSPCHRRELLPGVWVVTGPGGRGMTLSPALAEQTWCQLGHL